MFLAFSLLYHPFIIWILSSLRLDLLEEGHSSGYLMDSSLFVCFGPFMFELQKKIKKKRWEHRLHVHDFKNAIFVCV